MGYLKLSSKTKTRLWDRFLSVSSLRGQTSTEHLRPAQSDKSVSWSNEEVTHASWGDCAAERGLGLILKVSQ